MADQPSPRRRFQFRLRTLMIGVTMLALPLGYAAWHIRIVRERKELLSLVVDRGGGYLISDEPILSRVRPVGTLPPDGLIRRNRSFTTLSTHDVTKNPSWIRVWFGDESVATLWLSASVSSDDSARIVAAFPEANVCQYGP